MSTDDRNELIEAYFASLDDEEPEIARSALADGFVYESPLGRLEGFDGLVEYITERRSTSDSTHELTRRIHDADVSVVEGTVTGLDAGGDPTEADFCDVFEFDDDETAITRIAVYLNDS
jgi:ketosteroid isomerase-like protein